VAKADWDVPRTEAGLQEVLDRIEQCRRDSDDRELGNGLLALSYLVKWVRSDTAEAPFARSYELAIEALDAFRRCGDVAGQARALVGASPFVERAAGEQMLSEAERLVGEAADENCVAMVMAARARNLAMTDHDQSAALHRRALEIYRRTENRRGQAGCLFSLAITGGFLEEKRDAAIEAAKLYRAIGDHGEAARAMTLALMQAEELEPLARLEPLAKEGLDDALAAGDRGQEGHFYTKLSLIATARGDAEQAAKYGDWAKSLEESDGRTPLERWRDEVAMTKEMISMARTQGDQDAVKAFSEELKRLKGTRPN